MQRPDYWTAFVGLFGVFNLIALWVASYAGAPSSVGLYAGVAIVCFGALLTRRLKVRRS